MNRQNKHNKNTFRPCFNTNREIYNKVSRMVDGISSDEYMAAILDRHLKDHCLQFAKKNYRLRFLKKVGIVARQGKLVYIRKEYHERIQRIANSIGKGEISLFDYVDNVLSEHFATHREVITTLYDEHDRSIF